MTSAAAQLRETIDFVLAGRGSARLTLAPRLVGPGFDSGYQALDALLQGGLPLTGTSEIIGSRSSGRSSLAAACLAERTRQGYVCAWVDVSSEMDMQACVANGAELDRLLVIQCAAEAERAEQQVERSSGPVLHLVRSQPRRERGPSTLFAHHRVKPGTPSAPNHPLSRNRVEQVATDRLPARRGMVVLGPKPASAAMVPEGVQVKTGRERKPWTRLERGIRAIDLLVQSGGFGAIVFDIGSLAPEVVRRIPLATWFRWRAALVKSRGSLIVLSQVGCTGSSAELVLRVVAELPPSGSVLCGISYHLEVVRRRFAEDAVEGRRKLPQRASGSEWSSRAAWAIA